MNFGYVAVADRYFRTEHFMLPLQQAATAHIEVDRTQLRSAKATPRTVRAGYAVVADDEIDPAIARQVTFDHGNGIDLPRAPLAGLADLFANQELRGFGSGPGRSCAQGEATNASMNQKNETREFF